MLLALASVLIWNSDSERSPPGIDTAGVLQLMWLVGDEPHLRTLVAPKDVDLRQAGMFPTDMGELVRRKTHREDEGDYELLEASKAGSNDSDQQEAE